MDQHHDIRALQAKALEATRQLTDSPQSEAAHGLDPLVAALIALARHHGKNLTAERLTAGFTLPKGRLTLADLCEMGRAAGLVIAPEPIEASSLHEAECPALAILDDGRVGILEATDPGRGMSHIRLMPGGEMFVLPAAQARTVSTYRVHIADRQGTSDAAPGFLDQAAAGTSGLYGHAVFATLALNLLALAIPLYTMNVYDRVLPNAAMETLTALSIGAAIAILFELAMRSLRGVIVDRASQMIDVRLANRLFGRLIGAKLPPRPAPIGIQAHSLREYETLRDIFGSATLTLLGDLPFAVLFLVVIAILAGPLVIVPLLGMAMLIGAGLIVNRPLARLQEAAFKDIAAKNTLIVETLSGLETLKSLGAEPWAARRYEHSVAEHLRIGFWSRFWSSLGFNLVAFGQSAITIAMVVIGCLMVGQGAMTAGALMASMMLVSRALSPIAQIAALALRLHPAKQAWKAVGAIANAAQERARPHVFVSLPERLGGIQCEDIAFSYDPLARPALNIPSLRVAAGERIGLIGAIGSGKSTLLKLLTQLHEPQAGRILIGDLALGDIDPAQWRQRIGVCGQAPHLFQGTIRDNLTIHRPGASDSEILRAAHCAGAAEWIARLPRGYDTLLGENGNGLSGGQRQSLALARALIGTCEWLFLDEPTSDMDGRGEQAVIERLRGHLNGRGLVLVTHRPALLDLVERLVVFDNGRIVLDGPKDKVLAQLKAQQQIQAKAAAQGGAA